MRHEMNYERIILQMEDDFKKKGLEEKKINEITRSWLIRRCNVLQEEIELLIKEVKKN